VEKMILYTDTGYCKCEEVKRCRVEVTLVLVLAVFLHLSLVKVAVDGLASDSRCTVSAAVLKDLKLISGL
jgi:hypothetical protein